MLWRYVYKRQVYEPISSPKPISLQVACDFSPLRGGDINNPQLTVSLLLIFRMAKPDFFEY